MTPGGNKFNDFSENGTNQRNDNQNTEDFSFSRPWPWAYFLNGPNAAASIATLIRHCPPHRISSPWRPFAMSDYTIEGESCLDEDDATAAKQLEVDGGQTRCGLVICAVL